MKESDLSNESSHIKTVLDSSMISEHQAIWRSSIWVSWRSGGKVKRDANVKRNLKEEMKSPTKELHRSSINER